MNKEDIIKFEKKIDGIDKEIGGYDKNRVIEWHKARKEFEESRDKNQARLGVLAVDWKKFKTKIDELKEKMDEELKKEGKVKELKKMIHFCEKSLNIISSTKQNIIAETRKEIERETRQVFFTLLWKKETFKDISISEDYNINLIHSMGYECLGSVSAAERELLALSFTLALHKISGFDSPLIIDTPVARVSDEHRKNFGKIFLDVSFNKQTILLFTPAEYSSEISDVLDAKSSNRLSIKLSPNEQEARMEGL